MADKRAIPPPPERKFRPLISARRGASRMRKVLSRTFWDAAHGAHITTIFIYRHPVAAVAIITSLYSASLSFGYIAGDPHAIVLLDSFWSFFDQSIERLKVMGALLPLAIVFVAWRVYRSEQWWKRAEWALDASTDDSPSRAHLGKKAIAELGTMNLAPKKDRRLFNAIVTEDRDQTLLGVLNRDPGAFPG